MFSFPWHLFLICHSVYTCAIKHDVQCTVCLYGYIVLAIQFEAWCLEIIYSYHQIFLLLHLHIHAEHNQFIAYKSSEFSACTSVAWGDNKYLSYNVFTAYVMFYALILESFQGCLSLKFPPYIFPIHLCF